MSMIRSSARVNRSASQSGLTSVPGRIESGMDYSFDTLAAGVIKAHHWPSLELTGSARLTIILGQNRRGSGSVVEHLLAKEKVAGSNHVFRSKHKQRARH